MKNPFWKHPLVVALFSGFILAALANYFDNRRSKNELNLVELQAKINQHEKYLDELALASTNFYGAVENYILDIKEYQKDYEGEFEERIWSDIQQINFARAPLFAALEKIKISMVGEVIPEEIAAYYLLVLDIATLCQTRRGSKTGDIRRLLDEEYTPKQNLILYEVQKVLNELQN